MTTTNNQQFAVEREDDLRDLRARIMVIETIQNQLVNGVSRMSGNPATFLSGLLGGAEASLNEALRTAEEDRKRAAAETFRARSLRLIAALTPRGSPQ